MANGQVLLLVVAASPIPADTLRSLVATAAVEAGFTPGPWTSASGTSAATREEPRSGATGIFADGPWLGMPFTSDAPLPPVAFARAWTAIRMNVLNGPAAATGRLGDLIRAGVNMIPGVVWSRMASRTPTNAISWDHGVPAPLTLEASGTPASSGGGGWLLGLGAVAALAWVARSAGGLSGYRTDGLRGPR